MRLVPVLLLCVGCASTRVMTPTPAQHVTLVGSVSNLGLFADEEDRARDVLAKWLTAQGTPSPALDAAAYKGIALAREGRHALTGISCGSRLGLRSAARRWKMELGIDGILGTNVQCPPNAPCELHLWETRIEDGAGPLKHLQAPIDEAGAALEAFERAVPQLTVPPPTQGGDGVGMLGSRGADVVPAGTFSVRVFRADLRAREQGKTIEAPFPTLTNEEVLACMGPENNSAGALFEVKSDGTLGRCEADEHTCLCELLGKTTLSPTLHDSRWTARFQVTRRTRMNAEGRLLLSASWNRFRMPERRTRDTGPVPLVEMVNDPSLRDWSTPSARLLAGCFENRTQAGRSSSRWEVFFDDVGKVMKVEAKRTGWAPLDVDTAACVARLLRTSLAPCPARGGLSALVDAHVQLEEPKR